MVSCAAYIGGPNGFVVARFSPQGYETQPVGQALGIPGYHGPTDNWTVGNLGEIFGIAIDLSGNTYLSASANYNPFNFDAARPGGGVHLIDGSGNPSLLASLPNQPANDGWNGVAFQQDQEPALGNLCYVPQSNVLLVTNFDDGKIYSINAGSGLTVDIFDPMGMDNPSFGWAPLGERLWGIQSFQPCGGGPVEVYYSVWSTDFRDIAGGSPAGPNTIRRVLLDPNGFFLTTTDQFVLQMPGYNGGSRSGPVSDIAISSDGLSILLAERTMEGDLKDTPQPTQGAWAHRARLLEYTRTSVGANWMPEPITKYGVGDVFNQANCTGGVDYGLWDDDHTDGDSGRCDTAIWVMAAPVSFGTPLVYGLQQTGTSGGTYMDGVWIDLNVGSAIEKGVLGEVEVFKNCNSCVNPCDSVWVEANPTPEENDCCFDFTIVNQFNDQTFYYVTLSWPTGTGNISVWPSLPWSVYSFTPGSVTLEYQGTNGIPAGTFNDVIRICISSSVTPFPVAVEWLDQNQELVCQQVIEVECPPNPDCVVIVDDSLYCDTSGVVYEFWVENLTSWIVHSVVLHVDPSLDITVDPNPITTTILPNQTIGPFQVTLSGNDVIPGEKFCWFPSIHSTTDPVTAPLCCADSNYICHEIPNCNPCDSVGVNATAIEEGEDCCFFFSFSNHYQDETYYKIRISYPSGTGSILIPPTAPWAISAFGSSSTTLIYNDPLGIPYGDFPNVLAMCFSSTTSPIPLLFEWLDREDSVLCTDSLNLECTPDPDCVVIVDDSLYCEGNGMVYEFYVENHSTFPVWSLVFHVASGSNITVNPNPFILTSPINPGGLGGPYYVNLSGAGLIPGAQFCWFPSIHSTTDPNTAPYCCADSNYHCIEIPECSPCDSLEFYATGNPLTCTYQLCAVNNWDNSTFTSIQTELINGGVFTGITPAAGWHASFNFNPTNFATWTTNPTGPVPLGTSCIGEISLDYTPVPTLMVVRWMNEDSVICTDTLSFVCDSSCAGVLSDSIFCKGEEVHYNFNFFNNAGFTAQQLTFVIVPPSPGTIVPNPLIPSPGVPTGTGQDFSVEIQGAVPGSEFCYYIIVHDHADTNGSHLFCCPTDTICDSIPDCKLPCLPTIDVIGDTFLCEGSQTALCALPCDTCKESFATQWTLPGGGVSNTNCVIATVPGVFCVTVWCDGKLQGTVCQTITSGSASSVTISGAPLQKDCIGDPVTLTAEICCPEAYYHWSNGATTQSINVVTQPGWNTYTVTVYCGRNMYTASVSWYGEWCSAAKTAFPGGGDNHLEAFPNPFTETATIRFTLPVDDQATVDVFAADGRLVSRVFDGQVVAGKTIETSLQANRLARGIYHIRLQTASGWVETQKIILSGAQ